MAKNFWQQYETNFQDAINKAKVLLAQKTEAELKAYKEVVNNKDFHTPALDKIDEALPIAGRIVYQQRIDFKNQADSSIAKLDQQFSDKKVMGIILDVDYLKKVDELYEQLKKDYPIAYRIDEVKRAEDKAKEDADKWYNKISPMKWVSSMLEVTGLDVVLDEINSQLGSLVDGLNDIAGDALSGIQSVVNDVLPGEVQFITDKAFEFTRKGFDNIHFVADLEINVSKAVVRGDNVMEVTGDTVTSVSKQALKNAAGFDELQKEVAGDIIYALKLVNPAGLDGVFDYIHAKTNEAIDLSKQNREDALILSANVGQNLKKVKDWDSLNTFVEKSSQEASQKWNKNISAMSESAGKTAFDLTSRAVATTTGSKEAGEFAGTIAYIGTKAYINYVTQADAVAGVLAALSDPNSSLDSKIWNAGMAYGDANSAGGASAQLAKGKVKFANFTDDINNTLNDPNSSTLDKVAKLTLMLSDPKSGGGTTSNMLKALTDPNSSIEDKLKNTMLAYADGQSYGKASEIYGILSDSNRSIEQKVLDIGISVSTADDQKDKNGKSIKDILTDDKLSWEEKGQAFVQLRIDQLDAETNGGVTKTINGEKLYTSYYPQDQQDANQKSINEILASPELATLTLPKIQSLYPSLLNDFTPEKLQANFSDLNLDFNNLPFTQVLQQLLKQMSPDTDVSEINVGVSDTPVLYIPELAKLTPEQMKSMDFQSLFGIIVPYLDKMSLNDFKGLLPEDLRKDFPDIPNLSLSQLQISFPELLKGVDILALDLIKDRNLNKATENPKNDVLPKSIYQNLPEGDIYEMETKTLKVVQQEIASQLTQAALNQDKANKLTKENKDLESEIKAVALMESATDIWGKIKPEKSSSELTEILLKNKAEIRELKKLGDQTANLSQKSQYLAELAKDSEKSLDDLKEQIKKQQTVVEKERTTEGLTALQKPINDKIAENKKLIDQTTKFLNDVGNDQNRLGEINVSKMVVKKAQETDAKLKADLALIKAHNQRDYYKFSKNVDDMQQKYDAVKQEYNDTLGLPKNFEILKELKIAEENLKEAQKNFSWLISEHKYSKDQLVALPQEQQDFYTIYEDDRYPSELKLADLQNKLSELQNEISPTSIKNVNSAPIFTSIIDSPMSGDLNWIETLKIKEDQLLNIYSLDSLAFTDSKLQSKIAFVIDPNEVIQRGKELFHFTDHSALDQLDFSSRVNGDTSAKTNSSIVFIPSASKNFNVPSKGFKILQPSSSVKEVLKIQDGKIYLTVPANLKYAEFSKLLLMNILSTNDSSKYAKLIEDLVKEMSASDYSFENAIKSKEPTDIYVTNSTIYNFWASERMFDAFNESIQKTDLKTNMTKVYEKAQNASLQVVPYSQIYDADGDFIQSIKFVDMPKLGRLFYNNIEIKLGDVIDVKNVSQIDDFTYKPKANAYGDDTFYIKVSDGKSYSQYTKGFLIQIDPVNDLMTASPKKAMLREDGNPIILSNLYFNVSDPDSNPLNTVKLSNSNYNENLSNQIVITKISDGLLLKLDNKFVQENDRISIGKLSTLIADLKKDVDKNQFVQFKTLDAVGGEKSDNLQYSTNYQLDITAIPQNDAPKVVSMVKNIIVKTGETISLDNYIDLQDIDSKDDMLSLLFKTLPADGFGEINLESDVAKSNIKNNIKDSVLSITKTNLPYLTYTAPESIDGAKSKTFSVKVSAFDGEFQSSNTKINFTIQANNNAPVAKSTDLKLKEDTVYKLASKQFIFTDDEGDKAQTIKITKLPENAKLSYQSKEVQLNQVLKIADLNSLEIKPNENFIGNDSFNFASSDDFKTYGEETQFSFIVNSANDAPITESINLDFYNIIDNKFNKDYFKFSDIDAESDWNQFKSVMIKSLPKLGNLYLKDKLIEKDTVIDLINLNDLSYKTTETNPIQDKIDSFDFKVGDGLLFSEISTASINLKNHSPISTEKNAVTITMANDSEIKAKDFFTDPDGDNFTLNSIKLGSIDPVTQQLVMSNQQPSWIKLSNDKSLIQFNFSNNDLLNVPQVDYLFVADAVDSNGLISEPKTVKIKLTQSDAKIIPTADLQLNANLNSTTEISISDLKLLTAQGSILGTNFKGLLVITNIPKEMKISVNPTQSAKQIDVNGEKLNAYDFNSIQKLEFKLPKESTLNHEQIEFKLLDSTTYAPLSESISVDITYLPESKEINKITDSNVINKISDNNAILNIENNQLNLDGSEQKSAWDIDLSNVSTKIKGTPFDDIIKSGTLADTIDGGLGQDTIILNNSNDLILLANSTESADFIQNFSVGNDKLVLSKTNFENINLNQQIDIQVVDNNSEIYYLNNAKIPTKIATIEGVSTLSINDFMII